MIWTLTRRWLARHRGLLAVALVGLMVFEIGLMVVAEQFEGGPGMEKMVDVLPGFFQNLVRSKVRDFSADAVLSLGFHHPMAILVMCAMVMLFGTGVAADREEGLLGSLLARPVSRGAYLGALMLCVALLSVLQPLALLAGGGIGALFIPLDHTVPYEAHLQTAMGTCALLLAVGALALWAGVRAPRRGMAVTWLACTLVPLYLVEFLGFLWSGLDVVRWFSPFHYVPQLPSVLGVEPEGVGAWPLLVLALVCCSLAARRFAASDE